MRLIARPRYMRTFSAISPSLIGELARFQPDVILTAEYSMATVWSLIAATLHRVPMIIFQENDHPANARPSRKRLLYRRGLARFANIVLANTAAAEHEIVNGLRVPPTKVRRVQLLCPPLREELKRTTLQVSEPEHRPLFLFVGELTARKNARTLLEAAHLLRTQGETFSTWIVGDGPQRSELERSVRSMGLDRTVSFLGAVEYDRMGWIYEKADVFVMPTLVDYRSVAVLEAIRFGKPIIDSVFDGNVGDTVLPGQNGLTFDPTRPMELAECMSRLIQNADLLGRMSEVSQTLMKDRTTQQAAAHLYQLAKEVTGTA